jgi:hypothetical protein
LSITINDASEAENLSANLFSLLSRLLLSVEPIRPRLISFLLRRQLREWKRRGLIENYKTKTRTIAKLHYKIEIDLDVTPQQTDWVLTHALIRIFRRFRR